MEELYIGKKLVDLLPVEGHFYPFIPTKTVQEVPSVKSTLSALKRLQDLSELGSEYSRVYTPALPSADLLLKPGDEAQSPIPISVKSAKPGDLKVVQSGKRSGVIQHEGTLYRLKGCGNLTSGFIVEPMAFPEDGKELRGCCFEHTLARELFMSHIIQQALSPYRFQVGNEPLGFWKYERDGTDTVKFELPLIGKFCGVYRTLGEKRLGSHLINGMEVLAEKVGAGVDMRKIAEMFPAGRVAEGKILHTKTLLVTSGPLDNGPLLPEFTAPGIYKSSEQLLDLLSQDLLGAITAPEFSLDWVPGEYRRSLDMTTCASTALLVTQLLTLAYAVGREVGEIKRRLQDYEISWGYFIDHNPFEPHCNAHPNNFLVLNSSHDRVTAPVDFDMAFTFRGFMNNIDDAGKGVHDYTLFQSFVNSERIALEEALVGVENMANFKYADEGEGREQSALAIALRDELLLGYREGFDLRPDRHPTIVQNNQALWSTVELCLVCTQDYVEY